MEIKNSNRKLNILAQLENNFMMPHDLETAHETHKSLHELMGGTVIGNIISIIIASTILAVETWLNAGNIDTWASWLIKAGSAVVIYFGIKNGYLAMQKNKIELERLKNDATHK